MAVYLVRYELGDPATETDVRGELERCQASCRVLPGTWLVKTPESPEHLAGRLCRHMGQRDPLLVIETRDNKYGWLPAEAWETVQGLYR